MLDERASVAFAAGAHPQLLLPGGQRTNETEERFSEHKAHGQQMNKTEAQVAHKRPSQKVSNPDDDEAGHHKSDEGKMDHQNEVCQQGV